MRHASTSEPQYQEHACMSWERGDARKCGEPLGVLYKGGDVRRHESTSSQRDKDVMLAATSSLSDAQNGFVGGHQ